MHFSEVSQDSKGDYVLDQGVLDETESDEAYIFMSRPVDEVFQEEKDPVNVLLGQYDLKDGYKEALEPDYSIR